MNSNIHTTSQLCRCKKEAHDVCQLLLEYPVQPCRLLVWCGLWTVAPSLHGSLMTTGWTMTQPLCFPPSYKKESLIKTKRTYMQVEPKHPWTLMFPSPCSTAFLLSAAVIWSTSSTTMLSVEQQPLLYASMYTLTIAEVKVVKGHYQVPFHAGHSDLHSAAIKQTLAFFKRVEPFL